MSSHSQPTTQATQRCGACKRILRICCFGILRSTASAYNSCCKECRNYRRRKAYRPDSEEVTVFPLNENNRRVIKQMIDSTTKATSAESIKDGKTITFEMNVATDYPLFSLRESDGSLIEAYECGTELDSFVSVAIMILNDRCVRLNFTGVTETK